MNETVSTPVSRDATDWGAIWGHLADCYADAVRKRKKRRAPSE